MVKKTKHDLLAVMVNHCGEDKAISSRELGVKVGVPERKIRQLVTECRQDVPPYAATLSLAILWPATRKSWKKH